MISYAQNFEDVMLHRVFRDRSQGFYIDVGAWHPVFDSVTKFFYDEGWCGINIEPNEVGYSKLVADRPRDINLQVALGEREESRPLYVFEDFGNSTFEKSSRDRFAELGHESQVSTTKVTTLKAVCEAHVRGPIDFLKIDYEGWEKFVIRGADWERFRPTVLIVEATEPGTRIPSWAVWEPTLIENARYDMVYFDGINRFYLSRECAHLRTHFELPPNFHDEITLLATVSAAQVGKGFEQERDALEQERDALGERLAELEAESAHVKNQIVELQGRDTTQAAEIERLNAETDRLNTEIERLNKEFFDSQARAAQLEQTLLKSRLWVGQLSQELAARKRR